MSFFRSETLLLFCIAKVLSAAEPDNPCTTGFDTTVADMCTNDSAIEDSKGGSKGVDRVLLRITKQQTNCICHVSLEIDVTNYTIYLSKYGGLRSSAPVQSNCGLAVDVEYINTSESTLQSIECTSGTSLRSIALGGSELKFKSRIINGDLTRGYCMQISRDQAIYTCSMIEKTKTSGSDDDWIQTSGKQHTSLDECKKYCLLTEACVAVHYQPTYCFVYNRTTTLIDKDDSIYSRKQCSDTQKLKIRCFPPESTTQTDQETTTEETFTTKLVTVTKPISDNLVTNSNTQSTVEEKQKNIKDTSPSFLVALLIAIIGCTVAVIFAGTTVYYKRQLLTQKSKSKSSLESSVNYVDLSVARDVSNYSAINTQVGNEQYETVNDRK